MPLIFILYAYVKSEKINRLHTSIVLLCFETHSIIICKNILLIFFSHLNLYIRIMHKNQWQILLIYFLYYKKLDNLYFVYSLSSIRLQFFFYIFSSIPRVHHVRAARMLGSKNRCQYVLMNLVTNSDSNLK